MEATRASASPRSRDTKAGPNPPDVWHSRELHDGESQAAGNSGEPLALRPKSLVRQKVGQEVELHGRSPSPDRSYSNSASSLRSHFSQPRGPVPLDRSRVPALDARTRRPGHDGNCSSATPRTKQLRAADTKTGLQIPPRPRPEPPIRPARRHSARGRPSPAVAADVAAPEPPPPPPPRWGAFRFLFFGIVGRPVPPTLGSSARISRWSCTVYSFFCAAGG